ncbi:hypothetical protein QQX98_012755 [Neonectria punicea]|uniref:PD-(D/E)XK nuclease-like domain-containing protein n=1 Tax=Neonectria punicea TaxID=979145 RepID=A0ABR1GHZ6_9HYPO
MFSNHRNIVDWLNTIPIESPQDSSLPRLFSIAEPVDANININNKRKRSRPQPGALVTPSSSMPSTRGDGSPRPSKRPHVAKDLTPRPKERRQRSNFSIASGSESLALSGTETSQSQHSGRLSPQKYLSSLELRDRGIEVRDFFALKNPPPDLQDLLDTLDDSSRSQGVLDPCLRSELESHSNRELARIGARDFHFATGRIQVGHTPSLQSVLDIVSIARDFLENLQSEAAWSYHVSSAGLCAQYLPPFSPPKKVDYCIYIEPKRDVDPAAAESTIDSLRARLPDNTINHTNYHGLRRRPVALSVETKQPGEGLTAATLQTGIWSCAHWNLLRELSEMSLQGSEECVQEGDSTTQEEEQQESNDTQAIEEGKIKARLPKWLPAIIIQGHEWSLAITTQEGNKTILWTKLVFGLTNTALGVYQIIYGLQLLRNWARDTYWPYLKQLLLIAK